MKHTVTVISVFILILQGSCKIEATFDTPQPENEKSIASFPKHLLGEYSDSQHLSILTISNKLITRHFEFDYKEHKDSVSSLYRLIGDTLIDTESGRKEKIVLEGDSIIRHENSIDTIFYLSGNNLLKKYKGFYFLNIKYNELGWEVKKLSLKKGVLTIGSVSGKDDMQKLEEITETPSDTFPIMFSLTKRQFKKFVKEKGFSSQLVFTRILRGN